MGIHFRKALVAVLVVAAMAGCAKKPAAELGMRAPDITLADMNGAKVNLSDFKGKLILLDFFASWCPPCRAEIPDFIGFQNEYGPQGFTVVGVSLTHQDDTREFADRMGINYPVLIDDSTASTLYGPIRSIPTTFLIDRDMRIVRFYIGYREKEVFEADIKAELSK